MLILVCLGSSPSNAVFSVSIGTVSKIFCGQVLKSFVILSTILLPFKLPVASTTF